MCSTIGYPKSLHLSAQGPCSAGYYCEGGASSSTPWRNAAFPLNGPCPRGHYCPQGTLHPVPCPVGRTRSSPGEPLTRASHPPAKGPSLFNSHTVPQGHAHRTVGASVGLAPWGSLGGHKSRQNTKDRLAQCKALLVEYQRCPGGDPGHAFSLTLMVLARCWPGRRQWTWQGACPGPTLQCVDFSLQAASLRRAAGPAQLAPSARAWALALPLAPVWPALNAPGTPVPLVPLLCSVRRYLPEHGRREPRHPQGPVSGRSSQGLIGGAAAPSPRPHSAPQPPRPVSCSPALQAPGPKPRRKDKPLPSQGP